MLWYSHHTKCICWVDGGIESLEMRVCQSHRFSSVNHSLGYILHNPFCPSFVRSFVFQLLLLLLHFRCLSIRLFRQCSEIRADIITELFLCRTEYQCTSFLMQTHPLAYIRLMSEPLLYLCNWYVDSDGSLLSYGVAATLYSYGHSFPLVASVANVCVYRNVGVWFFLATLSW